MKPQKAFFPFSFSPSLFHPLFLLSFLFSHHTTLAITSLPLPLPRSLRLLSIFPSHFIPLLPSLHFFTASYCFYLSMFIFSLSHSTPYSSHPTLLTPHSSPLSPHSSSLSPHSSLPTPPSPLLSPHSFLSSAIPSFHLLFGNFDEGFGGAVEEEELGKQLLLQPEFPCLPHHVDVLAQNQQNVRIGQLSKHNLVGQSLYVHTHEATHHQNQRDVEANDAVVGEWGGGVGD